MTLKLTPDILRHAYDYLNATEPFVRWNLPDSDEIKFRIGKASDAHAWLLTGRNYKTPIIVVSKVIVGHTLSLMIAMAHEMSHLHQYRSKMPLTHGAAWNKLVNQICKHHGFDPKAF